MVGITRKAEIVEAEKALQDDIAAYLQSGGTIKTVAIGDTAREEISGKKAFSLGGKSDSRPAATIRD